MKQLAPTRPIMFPMVGSYFRENYQKVPDFADIYAPHYPNVKRASGYAEQMTRPVIFTEYAHQRGLARSGAGVLLSGNGVTLNMERANDTTIFSHLALMPGQSHSSQSAGDEVAISSKLKVQSIKTIAGAFKLFPLDTNWRVPLTQWFGAPDKKAVIRKAYYWSYDQ